MTYGPLWFQQQGSAGSQTHWLPLLPQTQGLPSSVLTSLFSLPRYIGPASSRWDTCSYALADLPWTPLLGAWWRWHEGHRRGGRPLCPTAAAQPLPGAWENLLYHLPAAPRREIRAQRTESPLLLVPWQGRGPFAIQMLPEPGPHFPKLLSPASELASLCENSTGLPSSHHC